LNKIIQSAPAKPEEGHENAPEQEVNDIDEDNESVFDVDSLNFLESAPGCPSSKDSWLGGH